MAFIGNQPTAVPLTSSQLADGLITTAKLAADAVTSAKILDSTIVNADIASTTINLTQKVTGTLPYANGGTGVSTLGTANQVLAVNASATALEFQSVSSDYVLLATTDASASASVSFDGYYSATYKNYKIIYSGIVPATGNSTFRLRFRRSNSDVTTTNYTSTQTISQFNTGSGSGQTGTAGTYFFYGENYINPLQNGISSTAGYHVSGFVDIFDPLNTSFYKTIYGVLGMPYQSASGPYYNPGFYNATLTDATTALSGITFYFSSGNITSGNFKLYGIK